MLSVASLPVCGLLRLLALLLLLPLAREGGQGQGRDARAAARGPPGDWGALASHKNPLQTYIVVGDKLIKSPRRTHSVGSERLKTSQQKNYSDLQNTLVRSPRGSFNFSVVTDQFKRSPRGSYSVVMDQFKRSPRGTYSVVGDQWGKSESEEGHRTAGSTGGGMTRLGKIPTQQFGSTFSSVAVEGGPVALPCDTRPPDTSRDTVRLVLWFKNDSAIPIYTFDTRDRSIAEPRHWSDTRTLTGRAFFKIHSSPAHLALENVVASDAGSYKCRVDFYRAPTQISEVALTVIVPPEKPKIYDMRGQEVALKLGPYKLGDSAIIKCVTVGGSPPPQLNWWREHSLLDGSYETTEAGQVVNSLLLENLQRADLHSILTCQASNNNISNPVANSVKIDLHFGPLSVRLLGGEEVMSAGRRHEARCQVVGARPPPMITWWKGSLQMVDNITTHTSPDGNVTLSTLTFSPKEQDEGRPLLCRATDRQSGDGGLEDGRTLHVSYTPKSFLGLGSSLNGSNIKEGDDVYFECRVRANPKAYKITWRRNGSPLLADVGGGVIVSNQSLVLQGVSKAQSGIYTCVAHNLEGDGVSNPITLNVRYRPVCQPDQVFVYGVARYDSVRISCEVTSNPSVDLSFHWVFNTSGETSELHSPAVKVEGSRSEVDYTPTMEQDYGNLLCWAQNSIGVQASPCVYHIIPAGRPDPLHNCSIHSQTISSLSVTCTRGFDGGLRQMFQLNVLDAISHRPVANRSSSEPQFQVLGLPPGQGLVLTIAARNAKGSSEPVTLHAFTMSQAEAGSSLVVADTSRAETGIKVTPALGILMALVAGLVLVAICIILVMRVQHAKTRGPGTYQGTHIPLQQHPQGTSFEHQPDILPPNKESIEEEEAFEVYREQQYATVARRGRDTEGGTGGRGARNNLRRMSEEVTYAELTLPRGKGYSQLVPRSQASALYAEIDHARNRSLPRGGGSCFPRSLDWQEEVTSQTPLMDASDF